MNSKTDCFKLKFHIFQNHKEKLTDDQLASLESQDYIINSIKKQKLKSRREKHFISEDKNFKCRYCEAILKRGVIADIHLYSEHKNLLSISEVTELEQISIKWKEQKIKEKSRIRDKPKDLMDPETGQFKSRNYLYEQIKKYFCSYPECGRGFSCSSKLQMHILSHTGEKPHQCTQCGKRFQRMKSLKTHMIIHTGVSKFTCSTCGKACQDKSQLNACMRRHTGEKPFKCSECDKCFTMKTHLTVHMRIHTGERPVECDKCHQRFMHHAGKSNHKCIPQ